jgi:hypothetical protein
LEQRVNLFVRYLLVKNSRKFPGVFGAEGRGRTDTVSLPLDFESSTSANSITSAYEVVWCCITFCSRLCGLFCNSAMLIIPASPIFCKGFVNIF